MIGVDVNILVRYAIKDDLEQTAIATDCLAKLSGLARFNDKHPFRSFSVFLKRKRLFLFILFILCLITV